MPVQSGNNAARDRAAARARQEATRRGDTSSPSAGGSLAGLTGKELARARRAQLSAHGKKASTSAWKPSASAARQNPAASRSSGSNGASGSQSNASSSSDDVDQMCSLAESDPDQYGVEADLVRSVCRSRRQAMAKYGKSALPPKPSSQGGPGRNGMPFADEARSQRKPVRVENDTQARSEEGASFESLCSVAKKRPARLGSQASRVRQICQARREAMANKGKRALPAKPASQGGPGRVGYQVPGYLDTSASGREAAKRHREMMCHYGRGSAPSCRPTGRRKTESSSEEASTPKKVETGHTISGHEVKGSQVERSKRVSGNEAGSCRAISGTEYIGFEQYDQFCPTRPQPNAPKVRTTTTARGHGVSGTAVGRAARVTGDERGTCESVTGTEYLSSEDLQAFCGTKARPSHADKVVEGRTEKQMRVTGSDEYRPVRATGGEAGAARSITGSEYADTGVARMTINGAPRKVAETHTYTGRTVSGTAVGRSSHVTGDEPGTCRNVSGTQYLSFEQYESFCDTRPEPGYDKVGIDQSRHGQRITGNLVDRSERVTGNEPGSCARLTGSQYGEPRLCGGGTDKVQSMHTLGGLGLTGQRVDHHPKMSGDEQGGCMPVTGTEYYGAEHYSSYCSASPAPRADKVEESMTCKGQNVGGTPMDRTEHVTGNEYGYDHYVSGTPYANAMHTGCAAPTSHPMAAPTQPSARYVPQDARPAAQASVQEPITAPQDFSVQTPARAARGRVTGSSFDHGGRITGPGNMAMGLITGTPEFRHPEPSAAHPRMGSIMPTPTPAPQAAAPAPAPAPVAPVAPAGPASQAPTQNAPAQPVEAYEPQPEIPAVAPADAALQCAPEAQVRERVTGEGGERCRISGDDWSRNGSVTGTEGQWAQSRNPSMRGQARGAVRNAWVNREVPRPDVPASKITGSSGNDMNSSIITYSGGARG